MKKIIFLISTFIFLNTNLIKAQTDSTEIQGDTTEIQTDSLDQFIETWKYSFSGLDKTLLPTGMLKEYSIFPVTVGNYNGRHDSLIDMDLIRNLHSQCRSIVLDNSKSLLAFDSIENRSAYYRNQNINPLVILDYKYNSFHDSAFAWHLIDTSNNQFVNVSGQTQSPYIAENVFGIAPFCFSMGRNTTVSFYIGADMYLGNNPNMINNLSINFGNGWQPLTPGLTVHNFGNFGVFDIGIRLTVEDGSLISCKFKVAITKSITDLGLDFHYDDIQADIPFDGKQARGVYVYRFGKGNASGCIKKPFIMTDGIDFGYTMDKPYGWSKCRDGKCNTLGFIDIYTGKDHNYENNTNNQPIPEFAKGSKLIDKLYDEGYDVIFLDFEAGAGYMQANAMLLIKLIDYINHTKCSKEEIVVCGPSMGGQIVRYALSYMETHNLKHCVRTAVYFDSPHKGANIPIGMQLWLNYFTNHNTDNLFDEAEIAVRQKLDRIATRQLLNNHYSASDYNQTTDRDYFMNDLVNNLGSFPKYIRQVAIPNGSCSRKKLSFRNGSRLIDMSIPLRGNRHTIRGVSYATCGKENLENRIFYGDALGGNNLERINWDPNKQPFDNAPGSSNDALKALQNIQDVTFTRLKYEAVSAKSKTSTFIPTNSGLCLTSNDLLYNVRNEISDPNTPNPSKYQFDAYYQHDDNQIHVEMTDGNIDWIIKELKRTENILFNLPNTYTYWGDDNQNHTVQNTSFNFGNHFRHTLNDIQINSGGKLLVNADLNTNYGLTNDFYNTIGTPFNAQYFELRTANCGSEVEVNNGGTFSIGDNNTPTNNKGIVYIKEGSNLYLNAGSIILLNPDSKLIIEKGANLYIEAGAIITLSEGSSLEIKGNLYLLPGAELKPLGSGKLVFDNSNNSLNIMGYNGSSIKIIGTNQEERLGIKGIVTIPYNTGLLRIEKSKVIFDDGAQLLVYPKVEFTESAFDGESIQNASYEGIKFYNQNDNQMSINNCKFSHAKVALNFSHCNFVAPQISHSTFYDNYTGVIFSNCGPKISSCKFNLNFDGIFINSNSETEIISSTFLNNSYRDLYFNALSNNANILLSACYFKNSNTNYTDLIEIESKNYFNYMVTISCSKFINIEEIKISTANLNLSAVTNHAGNSSEQGGFNLFNNSTLELLDCENLYMDNGRNDFKRNSNQSRYYMNGSIRNNSNTNNTSVNNNYFYGISGGNYPNGIPLASLSGFIKLTYLSANATYYLKGSILSTEQGGCSTTANEPLAPNISNNENITTTTLSKIYPNPAEEQLHIELAPSKTVTHIAVIDMQGKTMGSMQIAAGTPLYTMPVKDLPAGVYMILMEREGTVEKLKFVKQ